MADQRNELFRWIRFKRQKRPKPAFCRSVVPWRSIRNDSEGMGIYFDIAKQATNHKTAFRYESPLTIVSIQSSVAKATSWAELDDINQTVDAAYLKEEITGAQFDEFTESLVGRSCEINSMVLTLFSSKVQWNKGLLFP